MKLRIDFSKMKLAEDMDTFRGKYAYLDLPNGDKILYEICPIYPFSCEPYVKGRQPEAFQFGYVYKKNSNSVLSDNATSTKDISFYWKKIRQWKRFSSFKKYADKLHRESFERLYHMFSMSGNKLRSRLENGEMNFYFDEIEYFGDISQDILTEIQEDAFRRFFSSEIDYSDRNNLIERNNGIADESRILQKSLAKKLGIEFGQEGYWYKLICEYLGVEDLSDVKFEYNGFYQQEDYSNYRRREKYLRSRDISEEIEIELGRMSNFRTLKRYVGNCRIGNTLIYNKDTFVSSESNNESPYFYDSMDLKKMCSRDSKLSLIPFDKKYASEPMFCDCLFFRLLSGELKMVAEN